MGFLLDVDYRMQLCIILMVIEMSDKKTKVECRLNTQGTDKANAKVVDDLKIPDPESAVGEQVIRDVMEEGSEDDSETGNS
jgi:hypothetical protein